MKKQLVIIGIVIGLVGLSGCNSTQQTPGDLIIGKWHAEHNESVGINFTFYKNHSTCMTSEKQHFWYGYDITKNQIILINLTDSSKTRSFKYFFTDNNQKLNMTNPEGLALVFTRE